MSNLKNKIKKGVLIEILLNTAFILFSYCIRAGLALWLWTIIAIPVFGLPVLGYWQMFGLCWLIRLIFHKANFKS